MESNTASQTHKKTSLFDRFKSAFKNTNLKIKSQLAVIAGSSNYAIESVAKIEESLLLSDLGTTTTNKIISDIKNKSYLIADEVSLNQQLSESILKLLEPIDHRLVLNEKPSIIFLVGVNGSGKTTTSAKLALHYMNQGKKVLLVAADTFRAAAVQQLTLLAERINCPIYAKSLPADSSAVVYEAIKKSLDENFDLVIVDSSGRLHTKTGLLEELAKMGRVASKLIANAPHHKILVLDANTGQNANSQVKAFSEITNINGLILTKIDGSAKGGVIIRIIDEFHLPLHFVGLGESIDSLLPFDSKAYTSSLLN